MSASPPLVLIADNDRDVRELLGEVLRLRGARTELVGDGAAALHRLREPGVDLLVCDLDMPELDGEGLLRALDGLEHAPPALVVSGYIDAAIQQRLQRCPRVRGVLRKPFDVFQFAERALATARMAAPDRSAAG